MFDEKQLSKGFLEIRVGQLPYAIPVELVREIDQVFDITPLPNSSPYVCGLMNLRGQVLPVIDLSVRLGLAKTPLTRESCVIVVTSSEGLIGMLVDGVSRVMNIPTDSILPTPESCHLKDKTLVAAIARDGNRIITFLSLSNCLSQHPDPGAVAEMRNEDVKRSAVKLLS
jgi:purine-binding chemotaxis protein CheW